MGKPHGLRGDVYVVAISDDPHRFTTGSKLLDGSGRKLTVESSRPHGTRLLVKFAEVSSRAEAETLRGPIFVRPDHLRRTENGEYWHHEIVGCRVTRNDGEEIGLVQDIVPGPAQDLLVVLTSRGERLVPMVDDIVKSIDARARKIVIDPPRGLLE
ncbi:MAG: ribosome maturation factor RimM [Actinomycetota bacterium]